MSASRSLYVCFNKRRFLISVFAEHKLHTHRKQWIKHRLRVGHHKHKFNTMRFYASQDTMGQAQKRQQGENISELPSHPFEERQIQGQGEQQNKIQPTVGHSPVVQTGEINPISSDAGKTHRVGNPRLQQQMNRNSTSVEENTAGEGIEDNKQVRVSPQDMNLLIKEGVKGELHENVEEKELPPQQQQQQKQQQLNHEGKQLYPEVTEKNRQIQGAQTDTNFRQTQQKEQDNGQGHGQAQKQRTGTNENSRLQQELQNTRLGHRQGDIKGADGNIVSHIAVEQGQNTSMGRRGGHGGGHGGAAEQQPIQTQSQGMLIGSNTIQSEDHRTEKDNNPEQGQMQGQTVSSGRKDSRLQKTETSVDHSLGHEQGQVTQVEHTQELGVLQGEGQNKQTERQPQQERVKGNLEGQTTGQETVDQTQKPVMMQEGVQKTTGIEPQQEQVTGSMQGQITGLVAIDHTQDTGMLHEGEQKSTGIEPQQERVTGKLQGQTTSQVAVNHTQNLGILQGTQQKSTDMEQHQEQLKGNLELNTVQVEEHGQDILQPGETAHASTPEKIRLAKVIETDQNSEQIQNHRPMHSANHKQVLIQGQVYNKTLKGKNRVQYPTR